MSACPKRPRFRHRPRRGSNRVPLPHRATVRFIQDGIWHEQLRAIRIRRTPWSYLRTDACILKLRDFGFTSYSYSMKMVLVLDSALSSTSASRPWGPPGLGLPSNRKSQRRWAGQRGDWVAMGWGEPNQPAGNWIRGGAEILGKSEGYESAVWIALPPPTASVTWAGLISRIF